MVLAKDKNIMQKSAVFNKSFANCKLVDLIV